MAVDIVHDDRRGSGGRASALTDSHHRAGGWVECDRLDDPRPGPTTRAIGAARETLGAVAAPLARTDNHHIRACCPPRHRHRKAPHRAIVLTPVPLRVTGKNVDFLAIRRREHLPIANPHGRHPPLLPILGYINYLAFIIPDINRHYAPSTTNVI